MGQIKDYFNLPSYLIQLVFQWLLLCCNGKQRPTDTEILVYGYTLLELWKLVLQKPYLTGKLSTAALPRDANCAAQRHLELTDHRELLCSEPLTMGQPGPRTLCTFRCHLGSSLSYGASTWRLPYNSSYTSKTPSFESTRGALKAQG